MMGLIIARAEGEDSIERAYKELREETDRAVEDIKKMPELEEE